MRLVTVRSIRALFSVLVAAGLGLATASADAQTNYAFEQYVHAVGQGRILGMAMDLSGDRLVAADADTDGPDVFVFVRNGNQWALEQAIDVPDFHPATDWPGHDDQRARVAIAGDMLAIGSPGDPLGGNTSIGSVRIYRRVGNVWTFQQRIDLPISTSVPGAPGNFGGAISIDGDRMMVGAPGRGVYSLGFVFEFVRSGHTWAFTSALAAPGVHNMTYNSFGQTLSLSGDRPVVGATRLDRVFAYRRSGGSWQHEATFSPSNANADVNFGRAVAVSGDYAFVGAPSGSPPDGRSVHVYYRSAGTWGLVQRLSPAGAEDFGFSLAVDGDRLVVADPDHYDPVEGRRGRIHLYERNGLFWQERQRLRHPLATANLDTGFARKVDLDGDMLLGSVTQIAAPTATTDSGHLVAFRRPSPTLVLSTPVDFGAVGVGSTSAAKNLLVLNAGNAPLAISAVGAATAPFARVAGGTCGNLLPIVVPAGGSCTMRYTFSPAATGPASRSLSFTSNDPAGDRTAVLQGQGVTSQLVVSPGELFVGATVVGVPVGPATLTLQNAGAVSLTVQSIGAVAAPFGVVAGGTCLAPPFTLGPGQSCTRRYQYAPTAPGYHAAEFTITSSASNSPHAVSLSGFADGPGLSLEGGTVLDFGPVAIGASSATLTQTLFSSGVTDVTVQSIAAPPAPFQRVGGDCGTPPFTMPPDVSCTLEYRFAPDALGAASATIAVASDATVPVSAFELKGVGATAALLIGNNPLDLGGAKLGQQTAIQAATLTNVGNAPLTVNSIAAATAPFARVGGSCATPPFALAAGASCTLEYRFTAAVVGDAAQSLAVASNAPDSPATLHLLARGTQAVLSIAPGLHDFGTRAVGSQTQAPISLSNTGNAPLGIDAVGAGSGPFQVAAADCPAPPFILPEGATCNLSATFAPVAKGLFEANVALAHTADAGPASFTLRGRGAPSAPTLSPAALDFGILSVGQSSAPAPVTLTNPSTVPLAVGTLALAGGLDFAVLTDACSGQTLPATGSCQVTLRFAPVATGAAVDLLSVPSDAIGSPQTLPLQGTGVESLIFRDGFEQQP